MTTIYLAVSRTGFVLAGFDNQEKAAQELCDNILLHHDCSSKTQDDFVALYEQRKYMEAYHHAELMGIARGYKLQSIELNKSNFVDENE